MLHESLSRFLRGRAGKRAVLLILFAFSAAFAINATTAYQKKASVIKPVLIAHRGASAYAPEHTIAAYRLAIEQGADFVEQDLQVTRDGALVCLHDADLSRTTNVAELFPDRATMSDPEGRGEPHRGWYVADFTLAEIKRLSAGGWFNRANPFAARESFASERVPTLQEAIDAINDRAGVYIEIKHFAFYKSLGHDVASKLASVLKEKGYDRPDRRSRVLIQSFSKECLLHMREVAPQYTRIQLLPMEDGGRGEATSLVTASLAREIAAYANGVGPSKRMITGAKDVETFHARNLLIHPYTFRGPTSAVARRPLDEKQADGSTLRESIIADIIRYIEFGIDGGFTDYPDLWKEATRMRERK